MSFAQALEQLAKQAGVVLERKNETVQARQERESSQSLNEKRRQRLRQVMQIAAQFYHQELLAPIGAQARAYLRARAIDKAIAQRFVLGWADGDSRKFFEHMSQQKCSSSELLAAGLVVNSEQDRASARPRFRSRIIFPIDDRQGRTIAFGGRLLEKNNTQNEKDNDKSEKRFNAPKYLNSPETPLFSKGRNLYNFARAKESIRRNFARRTKEKAVLVEGYMDVIALDKLGCSASTASLGTALSEQQLALIWQLEDEPIICLDGDRAGLQAAIRAVKKALPLLNENKSLRVFFLPEGEDPDSFVNKLGVQQWRKALAGAETVSEFLWRIEKAERLPIDTPEKLASLDKVLEQHSQSINASTLQKYYRAFFKDALFQERRNLQSQRQSLRQSQRQGQRKSEGDTLNRNVDAANFMLFSNDETLRTRALQEMLTMVMAKSPELWDALEERFACIELPQDLDAIRQAMLLAYANAKPDEDIAKILSQSGGEALRQLARSQHLFIQNIYSKGKVAQEIVDKILAALDYIEISKELVQERSRVREQAIGLREEARRIFTQQ